jgi:DNA-binding response OmpR family regulator
MPPCLLVVDDRPAISFALSDYFGSLGWAVECATNVAEAERVLQRGDVALVIADLSLSGLGSTDGLELARQIRTEWPRVRTIILTAYGTPDIERTARRIGVDAFLHKPASLQVLARVAEALVGRSGGQAASSTVCNG